MEVELEVKLLYMDTERLQRQLEQKGAKKLGEEHQVNIRLDSSRHPIDPNHGYLRIRSVHSINGDEYHELTFKKQQSKEGLRNNIEYTVSIDHPKNALAIFENLGYDLQDRGKKHRISYIYQDARFDFDRWDDNTYPYPYVEIEVSHMEQLDMLLEEFSISKTHISTKSIAELKEEWKNKNIL